MIARVLSTDLQETSSSEILYLLELMTVEPESLFSYIKWFSLLLDS